MKYILRPYLKHTCSSPWLLAKMSIRPLKKRIIFENVKKIFYGKKISDVNDFIRHLISWQW